MELNKLKLQKAYEYISDLACSVEADRQTYFGTTIHATIHKGEISALRIPKLPRNYVLLQAADIPGSNNIPPAFAAGAASLLTYHQTPENLPSLAGSQISYYGQPVLLMAGPNPHVLEELKNRIGIQYQEGTPVLEQDPAALLQSFSLSRGKLKEMTFAEAAAPQDLLTSTAFSFHSQGDIKLEGTSVFCFQDEKNVFNIYCSCLYPHNVQQSTARVLNISPNRINVIPIVNSSTPRNGLIYPSLLSSHAALLCQKTRKPILIKYGKSEAGYFPITPEMDIIIHSAHTKDKKLAALETQVRISGGAFPLTSNLLIPRMGIAGCGPYKTENYKIEIKLYRTNTQPFGYYQGMGEKEMACALEIHFQKAIRNLNFGPYLYRLNHLHKAGTNLSTGQPVGAKEHPQHVLEYTAKSSDLVRKYSAYAALYKNRSHMPDKNALLKGIGLAYCFHGNGLPLAFEENLESSLQLKMGMNKKFRLLSSYVSPVWELIYPAILKQRLNLNENDIIFDPPDTLSCPDSGPSIGDRKDEVLLPIIEAGCKNLFKKRLSLPPPLETKKRRSGFKYGIWSLDKPSGHFYSSLCWEATAVEIIIEPDTLKPICKNIWITLDSGYIISHTLKVAQIKRAALKNLFSILSRELWPALPQEMPQVHVRIIDNPKEPYQYKGMGDAEVLGAAPAYCAAVSQALGIEMDKFPVSLEGLQEKMWELEQYHEITQD